MSDEKALLRSRMRTLSRTRNGSRELSENLTRFLAEWPLWKRASSVCAFAPLPGEPHIPDLWSVGKKIALPVVQGDQLSTRWVSDPSELQPGAFGILEPPPDAPPAAPRFDIILVPGLAFDLRGGRLGRGKGFYDRFLSTAEGLRVGLCFDDQIVPRIPCEPHDLRMNVLLTPSGIFLCEP